MNNEAERDALIAHRGSSADRASSGGSDRPEPDGREFESRSPSPNSDKMAARMFLSAFDGDSITAWIAATTVWRERPTDSPLRQAVEDLREAWYHDGTEVSRERCRRRAETLRGRLADPVRRQI